MSFAELEGARASALQALAQNPDDVEALRTAGRALFELGSEDAVTYFQRVTELLPDDPDSWHDLAGALVDQGRLGAASEAFRRAVQLRPDDAGDLVDFAHAAYGAGRVEEAVSVLEQAAERELPDAGVLRSLVAMYRRAGRLEDALAAATQVTELEPEDALATLDVAELSLDLGRFDDAVTAFARLRAIDPEPEHEVYAYHGMIDAELQRGRWRRALDLAVDATRVDRYGRTTDVLAYAVAKVFGEADRPAPSHSEIESALAASRAEHRRLHAEALVL